MNKKKLLALLMALVMTFSLVPVTAFAEEEPEASFYPTDTDDGWSYGSFADALDCVYNLERLGEDEAISIQLNSDITLSKDLSFRNDSNGEITYSVSSGAMQWEDDGDGNWTGIDVPATIDPGNFTIMIPVGVSVWLEDVNHINGEEHNIELFSAPAGHKVRKATLSEYYYLERDDAATPDWTHIWDENQADATDELLNAKPYEIKAHLWLDGEEDNSFFPMTSQLDPGETIGEALDSLWVAIYNFLGDPRDLAENITVQVTDVVYYPRATVVSHNVSDLSDEEAAALSNIQGGFVRAYEVNGETSLHPYDDDLGLSTGAKDVFIFTATDAGKEEITNTFGNSWYCDFTVSFDRDVKADSVILTGAYGGKIYSILLGKDFTANETKQFLISSVGYDFDYEAILNVVQSFVCTAINIDEANIGTTANVSLVMWPKDGNKETDSVVITTIPYEFKEDNLSTINFGETAYRHYASGKAADGIVITENNDFAQQTARGPHFATTYVAQIGNVKYETLQAAFAAAVDGDTITLLRDIALTSTVSANLGDKAVTLDLSSYDIASTDARALWVKSGDVTITGQGTISANGDGLDEASSVIRVGDSAANTNAASLTVGENVTVSSTRCYGITAFGINDRDNDKTTADITLTVNGNVSVTGSQAAISGNGTSTLSATTMTIGVNAVVTATGDYAIYHPGKGNLTVNGSVEGKGGIEMKGGSAIINSGASVTATASEQTHSAYNNGASTSGYAIAAVSNPNYAGEPAVTIDAGATITGKAVILADFNAENVGTVTAERSDILTDPDYKWVETETAGVYKLVKKDYVAQIGDDKYETLQAAFAAANAAQSEKTITLLDNVSLTEQIEVNGNVVLDLNGKNITTTQRLRLVTGSFEITGNGSITTTNSGMAPVDVRFGNDTTAKRTLIIGENVTLIGPCYGLNIFGTNDGTVANDIDVTINGKVNGMLFVLGNLSNTSNSIDIVVNGTVDASNAEGEEAVHTGIALNGNANVTVNNGATVKGESGIEVRAGRLTVNGGTITATADSYSYVANGSGTTTKGAAIAVAQHNTKLAVNATLNGGTLEGVKQISVTDVNSDMSAVNVVASESYTQNSVIPEGYKWIDGTTEGTKTLAKVTYVAQVGDTKYETLKAAVEAITGTTGTITLLADINLAVDPLTDGGYAAVAPADKEITLDLKSYTISGGALDVYGTLTITGSGNITGGLKHGIWVNEGGILNVQGGTITTTGEGYPVIANPGTVNISGGTVTNTTGAGAVYVNNGSLTISGGTVKSTKDDTEAVRVVGNTEATISGGTVSGHDYGVTVFDTAKLTVSGNADIRTADDEGYAISTNGNAGQNATVTINGGTITGKELGIYQPSGKLIVTDGTITGATGIYFKSNSLNITGGTITGNGDEVAYNYYGNGAHPTGDALVIDSCNYPNGINDVSVSGGSFNSAHAKAVGSYYGNTATAAVTNFITGGKYSSEPDSSYVADGYKAAGISDGSYKFQVGVVTVTPTTFGSINDSSVTFNVTTTVKEHKDSTEVPLESYTNLSVTVSGTSDEEFKQGDAATAVAALTNIQDDETLQKIVSSAIEAAGAKITNETQQANVTIQLAKSAATVESGKATYEVHPEAIIQVGTQTVGTVALNNSQIKDSFTFRLYALNIPGVVAGKKILVTHTHDDGTTEEHGPYVVDDAGYITLEGITSFSEFTLEEFTEVTASATYGYTISLDDSINIVFNVKKLSGTPAEYTVTYTFKGVTETVTLYDQNLNSITVASCAAKEMGEVVHVSVKYNNAEIRAFDLSIRGYCEQAISSAKNSRAVELCKAVLDYGRYAQEAFNYKTNDLVNGGTDKFTNANIAIPNPGYTFEGTKPSGITGVSATLITTSQTQLVVYFKYDQSVAPSSYTIKVGNEVVDWSKLTTESSKIKVVVTGIAAKNLGEKKAVSISYGADTYTINISPVDYMGVAKNGSQAALNRAFYNYYLKAVDYFNNK